VIIGREGEEGRRSPRQTAYERRAAERGKGREEGDLRRRKEEETLNRGAKEEKYGEDDAQGCKKKRRS